jgi:hypothetical protein
LRDRKFLGPQQWSEEVLAVAALKKEDDLHPQVNKTIVDKWHDYVAASAATARLTQA